MPAVSNSTGDGWPPLPPLPTSEAERAVNDKMAHQLLQHVLSKNPEPDGFIPHVGMPDGGDIPKPQGAYVHSLFPPGTWPAESESAVKQAGEDLKKLAKHYENANNDAKQHSNDVFSTDWTAGAGAESASSHYDDEHQNMRQLAHLADTAGTGFVTLSGDLRDVKQLMRDASDQAHREIEAQLRSNGGRVVNVSAITSRYGAVIQGYSGQLHGYVASEMGRYVVALGSQTGIPDDQMLSQGVGNSHGQDSWTGKPPTDAADSGKDAASSSAHRGEDGWSGGKGTGHVPGSGDVAGSPLHGEPLSGRGQMPFTPGPSEGLPSPHLPGTPHMPSLPASPMGGGSMPGMGQGMPLAGMFGKGLPSVPSTGMPAAGNPTQALSSAAGQGFGRGLMAGSGAASAMPNAVSQPVPHTPVAPLAAPASAAVPSAAAPAAAVTAPAAPAAAPQAMGPAVAAPATGGGGGGAPAAMSSYGAVIPPSTAPAGAVGGVPGGVPASPAGVPTVPGGSGGAGTGFVPVREPTTPVRVSRDSALSDLDEARRLVAELASASSVVDPGLGWAVGVGRSASGGTAEFWVATNEGNGYIPAGVFMRRTMPLAAAFDFAFDTRWFGWAIPAETAARAIEAQGLTVTAVASSGPSESDMLREKIRDVAFRVAPTSGPSESDAARLSGVRSHRLETVEPGLFYEMSHADQHAVDSYCRELTVQAAFYAGPELSPTAQAVAQQLISNQWPSVETWEALRDEYAMAVLMAGSQRPGFSGFEDPEQMQRYIGDFVGCRRVETLLCWETGVFADIVYAARAAGVALGTPMLARSS